MAVIASVSKSTIRFQGQYHDHETGLYYNRYRYCDSRGGRFVSKDPISYAGGGRSLVSERRIAYKAIRRAGLSPEEARCTIMKADSYFSGIGASATSFTNIPKRRGR